MRPAERREEDSSSAFPLGKTCSLQNPPNLFLEFFVIYKAKHRQHAPDHSVPCFPAETEPERERGNLGLMGRMNEEKKPRFLCLHGFRTSADIMKQQIHKWPLSVIEKLDLVFLDAPFSCRGPSEVEAIFPPPYYEWFQFDSDFKEYENLEKCLEYIEDFMVKQGPFDGLMGFSQGAVLSAALPALQSKGYALSKVPKIKFLIIIGGAMFNNSDLAEKAHSSPMDCPSLHFIGELDFLKPYGTELLKHFVDPVVIHHPKGHTVPRLDEKSLESVLNFVEKIQNIVSCDSKAAIHEEDEAHLEEEVHLE